MIGKTISSFRIVEKLGEGGMGEVYRALDTKLDRDVAIKVLPPTLTGSADRLARFRQEAKVLASLNHPNIASIHGFEEAEGVHFLVLECVPGSTLQELLAEGPLPIEEALDVCRQIAEAMEAAHGQGIIHRDLKPANVKLTPEGIVKVLDFGLAKSFDENPPVGDPRLSPTITQEGVILGTAAYMSPEQARGKPLDKRTDVWSFGCLLYETLTGQMTFCGETIPDTLAAVLNQDPRWDALPAATPASVRLLLERTLQKDPRRRLRDIGDAWIEIDGTLSGSLPAVREIDSPIGPPQRRRWPWVATCGVMTLAILVLLVVVFLPTRRPATESASGRITRFTVIPPVTGQYRITEALPWQPSLAVSPDGKRLVYAINQSGQRLLYLHELDGFDSHPIDGTQGARSPFFSPDGRSVAFFTRRELKTVSLATGKIVSLCQTIPVATGGCWETKDTILFTPVPVQGLVRVRADRGSEKPWQEVGTEVTHVNQEDREWGHHYPTMLADGKTILFTVLSGDGRQDDQLAAYDPDTMQEPKILLNQATGACYDASSDRVVFGRQDKLLAVSLDPVKLEVGGTEQSLVDGVVIRYASEFGLSRTGVLAYVPGTGNFKRRLVWMSEDGTKAPQPLGLEELTYSQVRISPDGQRLIAVIEGDAAGSRDADVLVCDLETGRWEPVRVSQFEDLSPMWGLEPDQVIFSPQTRGESGQVASPMPVLMSLDSTDEKQLVEFDESLGFQSAKFATSLAPDGEHLLYTDEHPQTNYDIWLLPMKGDGKPAPLTPVTDANETGAVFSPDGQWIAYQSDEEGGRFEIWVRPFPIEGGRPRKVSVAGGTEPAWAPDQQELKLFYRNADQMLAVQSRGEDDFDPGIPELVFQGEFTTLRMVASYDVGADGRFLMIEPDARESAQQVNVVVNWDLELESDRAKRKDEP